MPQGSTWRYDGADGAGTITDANSNSFDVGGNVYQGATALTVDVSPLQYWQHSGANPVLALYAGVSAQAVSPSLTNYVYLNQAGTLVVNTSGFPNPEDEPFVPLAEVVTSAQAITSITDRRPKMIPGGWTGIPSYTVAGLPSPSGGYWVAFATDGRKTGEGAAAGTGVVCYWDGAAWRRVDDGTTVLA